MSAAELIARSGARLEIVSPERFFAPEMGGMNHVGYMRAFQETGATVTINTRLSAICAERQRADGRADLRLCAGLARRKPGRAGRGRARHGAQ
jgi:hypothetical protein